MSTAFNILPDHDDPAYRVTPEFYELADYVVQDFRANHPQDEVKRSLLEDGIFFLRKPTPQQLAAISPTPKDGQVVLGLHHGQPGENGDDHFIILYQEGIETIAKRKQGGLPSQLMETLLHETEHHLGVNHTMPHTKVAGSVYDLDTARVWWRTMEAAGIRAHPRG